MQIPASPISPAGDSVPAELVRALAQHRDRLAMQDAQHRLTYGALSDFVRGFQHLVPEPGPVAVFGAPSVLLGAAVTASVISGRPFVHLDPAMPQAVLANILDELQIATVITCQAPTAGQLPTSCRVIEAASCLGAGAAPLAVAEVGPKDSIYLVATSGTTGRPKCIPVTHDAAHLSYAWRETLAPYAAGMRVGIYIFAIWELLRPLRHGAELYFPSTNDLMSPQALVGFLARHSIHEMLFTPSFFAKILSAIRPEAALPLRRVILNGEVVSPELAADALARLPGAELWNLYSICETHDICMTRLTDPAQVTGAGVPVGIPMPHLRAVVLDEADQPCPPGQPGLLYFEGERMLGPGYVNRPEETAQRFRNLRPEGRAARLYDTGDRAYVAEDGTVHVLGRVAHMLKLRGHSIQTRELTETMAGQLTFGTAIPWVQQAGAGQSLVFYYTADAAQQADNAARWGISQDWQRLPRPMAEALQAVLPRYCIPAWLARLDEIPLHPVSGKTDFKALPPVPAEGGGSAISAVPTVEAAARILGCRTTEVDAAQSFHEQGGDSLMCVDLLLSLERSYGRAVDFDWALNLPLARLHALLSQPAAPITLKAQRPGILLTGATGFLGGHVLPEVMRQLPPDQVVYCLVRPNEGDPAARLAARATLLGLPQDRVIALPGNLDEPRFGLSAADHAQLARQVSRVIHCAAMVNLAIDRDRMESWSRAGIETVLDFCREAGAPLAFSSSTSIFPDRGGPYPEGPAAPFDGISGYGAAKIAAEAAIAASGVPALILRLPSLYDLEAPNPKDIYETILAACREAGRMPEGLRFRMTDVRAAAALLARFIPVDGAIYANLIADALVAPDPDTDLPAAATDAWLDTAPLAEGARRLLRDAPFTLSADAAFETGMVRQLWAEAGLGDYASISQPERLLARRLQLPATTANLR